MRISEDLVPKNLLLELQSLNTIQVSLPNLLRFGSMVLKFSRREIRNKNCVTVIINGPVWNTHGTPLDVSSDSDRVLETGVRLQCRREGSTSGIIESLLKTKQNTPL